jgi:hypothetical protein
MERAGSLRLRHGNGVAYWASAGRYRRTNHDIPEIAGNPARDHRHFIFERRMGILSGLVMDGADDDDPGDWQFRPPW